MRYLWYQKVQKWFFFFEGFTTFDMKLYRKFSIYPIPLDEGSPLEYAHMSNFILDPGFTRRGPM